jgi:hypothetical protein
MLTIGLSYRGLLAVDANFASVNMATADLGSESASATAIGEEPRIVKLDTTRRAQDG